MAKDIRAAEKYIGIDPNAYVTTYYRINSPLRYGLVHAVAPSDDEYVLLVMHCSDAQLVILSTKRFLVYQIPVKKSFLQRVGSFTLSFTTSLVTDNIPLVSDASTLMGGVDAFKSIRDRFRRSKELPLKKDAIYAEWDINNKKDEETRANERTLILYYTDQILLENGWYWKKTAEIPMKQVAKKRAEILIGSEGIKGKVGGKKVSIGFVTDPTTPNPNYLEIARLLINKNWQAFVAAGWQADVVDGHFLLKK